MNFKNYNEILDINQSCVADAKKYLDELGEVDAINNSKKAKSLIVKLLNVLDCLIHNSRQLPLEMGVEYINGKHIHDLTEELVVDSSGVKVDYIKDNWLSIRLPAIPPKRSKHYSQYLFLPLQYSLRNFFHENLFSDKRKMVLCYRFVYAKTVPLKSYLDFDNLEVKMITDIITSHTTFSDHPTRLNNYYCSAQGEETHTEVFLVPAEEFSAWLEWEKTISEKGILE